MVFNKDIHQRKSIRLRGYDYSQPGAYFITICTHQRQQLFGKIRNEQAHQNIAEYIRMNPQKWRGDTFCAAAAASSTIASSGSN